jgi:hypothetical protein
MWVNFPIFNAATTQNATTSNGHLLENHAENTYLSNTSKHAPSKVLQTNGLKNVEGRGVGREVLRKPNYFNITSYKNKKQDLAY